MPNISMHHDKTTSSKISSLQSRKPKKKDKEVFTGKKSTRENTGGDSK